MTDIGTDQQTPNPPLHSAAEVLYKERERIIAKWLSKISYKMEAAKKEPRPLLVNTLPNFLINLSEALTPNDPRRLASDGTSIAQEHGGERARLTNFSPEDILQEYQILRDVVFSELKSQVELSEEERNTIYRSFDKAMTEAMTNYFLVLTNLREKFSLLVTFEIRKPLSSISGKSILIKHRPQDTDIVVEAANDIQEELRKINFMIQELLDPSLLRNSSKLRLPLEELDLYDILESTVSSLQKRFGDRFVLEGVSVPGYWNYKAIRQAVESLCTNAFTYGDSSPITIKLEENYGRAVLTVHNRGKVIPAEKQEHIFQSFRRKENVSTNSGWGVGLPLVRGVAEAHGGSVGVDSSIEKGTTFFMDMLVDSRPYQASNLTPGSDDPRNFDTM